LVPATAVAISNVYARTPKAGSIYSNVDDEILVQGTYFGIQNLPANASDFYGSNDFVHVASIPMGRGNVTYIGLQYNTIGVDEAWRQILAISVSRESSKFTAPATSVPTAFPT